MFSIDVCCLWHICERGTAKTELKGFYFQSAVRCKYGVGHFRIVLKHHRGYSQNCTVLFQIRLKVSFPVLCNSRLMFVCENSVFTHIFTNFFFYLFFFSYALSHLANAFTLTWITIKGLFLNFISSRGLPRWVRTWSDGSDKNVVICSFVDY